MSRFWPHEAYAEDQSLAKTILYTHVIHRGFQVGAIFGGITGGVRAVIARRRAPTPGSSPQLLSILTRSTGYGALVGAGLLGVVGTVVRMWGREEIEWKDRSWRLQENKGQLECDDWSLAGTGAGLVATLVKEAQGAAQGKALRILGGTGLGNLAGVAGYMAWRYGVNSGKFD